MMELCFYIKEKPYLLLRGRIYDREFNEVHAVHSPKAETRRLYCRYRSGCLRIILREKDSSGSHNPVDRDERLMELILRCMQVYIKKSVAMKWK